MYGVSHIAKKDLKGKRNDPWETSQIRRPFEKYRQLLGFDRRISSALTRKEFVSGEYSCMQLYTTIFVCLARIWLSDVTTRRGRAVAKF